jgi:hypothetical protein
MVLLLGVSGFLDSASIRAPRRRGAQSAKSDIADRRLRGAAYQYGESRSRYNVAAKIVAASVLTRWTATRKFTSTSQHGAEFELNARTPISRKQISRSLFPHAVPACPIALTNLYEPFFMQGNNNNGGLKRTEVLYAPSQGSVLLHPGVRIAQLQPGRR